MHKSTGIGRADIHAGTLANGIESFKNRKILGRIPIGSCSALIIGCHEAQGYRADLPEKGYSWRKKILFSVNSNKRAKVARGE